MQIPGNDIFVIAVCQWIVSIMPSSIRPNRHGGERTGRAGMVRFLISMGCDAMSHVIIRDTTVFWADIAGECDRCRSASVTGDGDISYQATFADSCLLVRSSVCLYNLALHSTSSALGLHPSAWPPPPSTSPLRSHSQTRRSQSLSRALHSRLARQAQQQMANISPLCPVWSPRGR